MSHKLAECVGQNDDPSSLRSVTVKDYERILPLPTLSASFLIRLIIISTVYFVLAFLCLRLASIHPSITPIWAPTGLAIAAVMLWGYRIFPAIFVPAFLISLLTTGSTLTSLSIACGNTLEAVAAVYLFHCWKRSDRLLETPLNVITFFLACLVATAVSATIGVGSLGLSDFNESFLPLWLTWWVGNLAGALVVTPVIMLWAALDPTSSLSVFSPGTVATYLAATAVGIIAFCPLLQPSAFRDALSFLVILPLMWAAVRQGPRDTATASLIIVFFTVWGAVLECGPFADSAKDGSYAVLLVFVISITVPALALSAEVSARRRVEALQKKRALEAELLWQATEQAAVGGSFNELLRYCLQRICQVGGWVAGHAYLPDDVDAPKVLHSSAVWHFEDRSLKSLSLEAANVNRMRGQGLPGKIWASGKPKWLPDISRCDQPDRKKILLQHGLRTGFGFPIYAEGKLQAVLEFFSFEKKPPDKDLIHVVQSIGEQLGRVIERKRSQEQQAALETTLNSLTLAIFFTDTSGRIDYMNRAAKQQIRTANGLRSEKNRLVPTHCKARDEFYAALKTVAPRQGCQPISPNIVPLPAKYKPGLIAIILPLDSSELKSVCGTVTATVAVLVQDSAAIPLSTAEAFSALYGLTKSELRVLLAMRPARSLKHVAETLTISEPTARTHLQHIYAKTGTSKQSELLDLFMRFTPPIETHEIQQLPHLMRLP
jgi:integral membrane sensor domain MASE1/DNA-binding CsgD family transcriptional regulator